MITCPGDADDIWFDAVTGFVFQTGGDGHIGIFKLSLSTGALTFVQQVRTSSLARTSHFDPESRQLFVAVPRPNGQDNIGSSIAAVWVYDIIA